MGTCQGFSDTDVVTSNIYLTLGRKVLNIDLIEKQIISTKVIV